MLISNCNDLSIVESRFNNYIVTNHYYLQGALDGRTGPSSVTIKPNVMMGGMRWGVTGAQWIPARGPRER